MRNVEENAGKCAILWILGEYGDKFIEAPYILEQFIDAYDDEESSEVKLEMLCSSMKLFFKKAPEVQMMLGRLLQSACSDTTKVDVRDRAVFYYKLLKYDPIKAEKIVNCPKISVNSFVNIEERAMSEKIFNEFNTLSVIYKKPAELFINAEDVKSEEEDDGEEDDEEEEDEEEEVEEDDEEEDGKEEEEDAVNGGGDVVADVTNAMGDMLDLGMSPAQPRQEKREEPNMRLRANAQCTSKLFQKIWKGTKDRVQKLEKTLGSENECSEFEQIVNNAHFKTMAAAPNGRKRKFYFYAQESDNDNLHFLEVNINLDTLKVKITVKGQSDLYQDVGQYFCYTLNSILAA